MTWAWRLDLSCVPGIVVPISYCYCSHARTGMPARLYAVVEHLGNWREKTTVILVTKLPIIGLLTMDRHWNLDWVSFPSPSSNRMIRWPTDLLNFWIFTWHLYSTKFINFITTKTSATQEFLQYLQPNRRFCKHFHQPQSVDSIRLAEEEEQ
jgi:hypothetical protein